MLSAWRASVYIPDSRNVKLTIYANPPITTVRQPKYEMGALATGMLLERMREQDLPVRIEILEPELVVRRSTAPIKEIMEERA